MAMPIGAFPYLALFSLELRAEQLTAIGPGTGLLVLTLLALVLAWAGYVFWFWQRMFRRLPALLSTLGSDSDSDGYDPVTRPVGGVLPGLAPIVFGACSCVATGLYYHHTPREMGVSPAMGAVLLAGALLSLAVPIWAVRRTVAANADDQSILRDRIHYALGYPALVATIGVFVAAGTAYEPVKRSGLAGIAAVRLPAPIPEFIALTPLLLGLFLGVDLYNRARDAGGLERIGLLVVLWSLIFGPMLLLTDGTAMRVLVVVLSIGAGGVAYRDIRRAEASE